jgi:hypothetical protein
MARRTRVITHIDVDLNEEETQPFGLIVEDHSQIGEAVRGLTWIGHDHVNGFLAGGLAAWETNGR